MRIEEFREDGERRWWRTEKNGQLRSRPVKRGERGREGRPVSPHAALPSRDNHEHLGPLVFLVLPCIFLHDTLSCASFPLKFTFARRAQSACTRCQKRIGRLLTHKPALIYPRTHSFYCTSHCIISLAGGSAMIANIRAGLARSPDEDSFERELSQSPGPAHCWEIMCDLIPLLDPMIALKGISLTFLFFLLYFETTLSEVSHPSTAEWRTDQCLGPCLGPVRCVFSIC